MFIDIDRIPFTSQITNNLSVIRDECERIIESTPLWREAEIYEGEWKLFVFYDYEAKGPEGVDENLARCPETARILKGIPGRCAASFSILGPNSRIKPHLGLDNGQLRLHCSLIVPSACTLGAMASHAGLDHSTLTDAHKLFGRLGRSSAETELFWEFAPRHLSKIFESMSLNKPYESAIVSEVLATITKMVDDVSFPIKASGFSYNQHSCPATTEWTEMLKREQVLRHNGRSTTINIDYPSQTELVRWLNTAMISEVIFPGAFSKSLRYENRTLVSGEAFLFSDAYIHGAENCSAETRAVLLVDFDPSAYDQKMTNV